MKFLLAGSDGLCVGAAILFPILANAAVYTAAWAEAQLAKRQTQHQRGEPMRYLLAGSSFVAGLCVGAAILLPILAHASEYTAVGRDSSGEMVLVEFDETDKAGNLSGLMWRRLEVLEVDGKWCGKGRANFEGVKVEVVK